MLLRKESFFCENLLPIIQKFIGNNDVSDFGAFVVGTKIKIKLKIQRAFGDGGIVIRIHKDFNMYSDIKMDFYDYEKEFCVYETVLKLEKGLYFWEILIIRNNQTLFTSSENNKDFHLSTNSENPFALTIFDKKYGDTLWISKGTMYQIFVDRFFRGDNFKKEDCIVKDGAILESDFYSDNLEYAKNPGDEIKNNHFFGGTIFGIVEKLEYLKSLGISTIYLNPIFDAKSNHKYDTGDYEHVDCMFGGDSAFDILIQKAKEMKISIILDGVFNHTGDDSKYFNKYGNYPEIGAYQGISSKYYGWYKFGVSKDDYECWWNIKILPKLNHENEECRKYFTGKNGIGAQYAKKGIAGWRLDVVDELSNDFLNEFVKSVKSINQKNIVIGEVWENAALKISYSKRRQYFIENQLDSVMNYPLRNGIIKFCIDGNAKMLYNILTEIYSTYPKNVSDCLMNLLSTHDTERILTILSIGASKNGSFNVEKALQLSNEEKANYILSDDEIKNGKELLMVASILQFTIYGVPCVYYGDEIGLQGFRDPFSRKTYKWGNEDREILNHYRILGKIRKDHKSFVGGQFKCEIFCENGIKIKRQSKNEKILVFALCKSPYANKKVYIDGKYKDLITNKIWKDEVLLDNNSSKILLKVL